MSIGDIYSHSNFRFSDGTIGNKLFIVLNEPNAQEPYLVLKTTSQFKDKTYASGCNPKSKLFYIPVGNSSFPVDTLVQIEEIFEFSREEFLKGSLTNKIIAFKDTLSSALYSDILKCLKLLKDDVSDKHYKLIFQAAAKAKPLVSSSNLIEESSI